ncbi:MAG: CDP-glycerol glycerophosphotransferase family protein [bacterium]
MAKEKLVIIADKLSKKRIDKLIIKLEEIPSSIDIIGLHGKILQMKRPALYYHNEQDLISPNYKWSHGIRDAHEIMDKLENNPFVKEISYCDGCFFWNIFESKIFLEFLIPAIEYIRHKRYILDKFKPTRILMWKYDPYEYVTEEMSKQSNAKLEKSNLWDRYFNARLKKREVKIFNKSVVLYIPLIIYSALSKMYLLFDIFKAKAHNKNYKREQKGDKKIGILTLDERFADIVIPVINEIDQHSEYTPVVIERRFSAACRKLNLSGIKYLSLAGFANYGLVKKYKKLKKEFDDTWERLRDAPNQEDISILGVNVWGEFIKYLDSIRDTVYELILINLMSTEFFNQENIHCLLITDDCSPFQRMLIESARKLGVKTMNIQNSFISGLKDLEPIYADFVACDGNKSKSILMRHGAGEERIFVTGQPRFDFIQGKDQLYDRSEILNKLSINKNKKVITIATQPVTVYLRQKDINDVCRVAFMAARYIPDSQIIIKLHPNDYNESKYLRIAKEAGNADITFVKKINIWELLFISDLVITFFSTVGYEAIVMDKDLIQIDLKNAKSDIIDYTENGAAIGVYLVEDLKKAINSVLMDAAVRERLKAGRREYLLNNVFGLDGLAASRVVEAIGKIL